MHRRRFAAVFAVVLASVPFLFAGTLAAQQPQLHVVTYVDVYPNFAAQATEILNQFRAASRADEGSVRFEVMRDVARSNHFAIVEVWQSRALYDAHLAKPHNREFRDQLQPMLGSPFDERLYNLVRKARRSTTVPVLYLQF